MHYYAEYSMSKKGWFVYQETVYGGAHIYEGPYSKEKAYKRAAELNEEHSS